MSRRIRSPRDLNTYAVLVHGEPVAAIRAATIRAARRVANQNYRRRYPNHYVLPA